VMRDTAGSAAAPAARCRKFRRGRFVLKPSPALFLNRLSRLCVCAHRQTPPENPAFSWLARHPPLPAPPSRQLAGDGKAEPGPAEALSGRGISLAELLEQLSLLLRSQANARIGDRELDPATSVGDPARMHPDLAFLGELAGIAQQVEQNLPQPHGVHGQCAEVLLGIDDEAVLVLLCQLS